MFLALHCYAAHCTVRCVLARTHVQCPRQHISYSYNFLFFNAIFSFLTYFHTKNRLDFLTSHTTRRNEEKERKTEERVWEEREKEGEEEKGMEESREGQKGREGEEGVGSAWSEMGMGTSGYGASSTIAYAELKDPPPAHHLHLLKIGWNKCIKWMKMSDKYEIKMKRRNEWKGCRIDWSGIQLSLI